MVKMFVPYPNGEPALVFEGSADEIFSLYQYMLEDAKIGSLETVIQNTLGKERHDDTN